MVCGLKAQKSGYDFSLYGFVRGELYYNTRDNVEGVDGLFYLYPKDIALDADGADMNAVPNGSFYTFATRFGVDIKGPDVGSAKVSAKVESDFGGTTNINFMLRIRQIYLKMAWDSGSTLLLGQTWHPMFGDVIPTVLNLSTGSPFQPFNRSPQLNYQFGTKHFRLTAAAIYQLVYLTQGVDGKTENYLKYSGVPEFYLGGDYRAGSFLFGGGAEALSIKPRRQSTMPNNITFRVNERLNSFSYELHSKFSYELLSIAAKTLLAENQTHNTMLGGFGVTEVDPRTGEQKYTPFRHSTTWVNLVYGKTCQGSLFLGYTKNLGVDKPLYDPSKLYGTGLDIDQLMTFNFCFSYNLPHWKLGAEYTHSLARYGDVTLGDGLVRDCRSVRNNRFETIFMYFF
jgi:hypothetical protein